ncbi:hypothetical protein EC973_001055 [Apophysomyces ossiformis]|uniref:Uncharacterized protein n=1 Tax=Apophysomyces ossiformis TaxID=679940 RepID=A0A8H7BUY1_9FUNG|nr:hypothetical protein EC973_001055 [Apophysomyces ossiformis]
MSNTPVTKGTAVASKQVLLGKIVEEMKKEGITYRKEADIRSKISTIQIQFSKAADWLSNTGNGVMNDQRNLGRAEEDVQNYIKGEVVKICKYYYQLEPFFGDRPASRALFSNVTDGDDSSVAADLLGNMDNADNLDDEDTRESSVGALDSQRDKTLNRGKKRATFQESILNLWHEEHKQSADIAVKRAKFLEDKLEIERKKVDASERKAEAKLMQAKAIQVEAKVKAMKELIELGFTKEDAFDRVEQMFGH